MTTLHQVRSVEEVYTIIETFLAEEPELTYSRLSQELGIAASMAQRLLASYSDEKSVGCTLLVGIRQSSDLIHYKQINGDELEKLLESIPSESVESLCVLSVWRVQQDPCALWRSEMQYALSQIKDTKTNQSVWIPQYITYCCTSSPRRLLRPNHPTYPNLSSRHSTPQVIPPPDPSKDVPNHIDPPVSSIPTPSHKHVPFLSSSPSTNSNAPSNPPPSGQPPNKAIGGKKSKYFTTTTAKTSMGSSATSINSFISNKASPNLPSRPSPLITTSTSPPPIQPSATASKSPETLTEGHRKPESRRSTVQPSPAPPPSRSSPSPPGNSSNDKTMPVNNVFDNTLQTTTDVNRLDDEEMPHQRNRQRRKRPRLTSDEETNKNETTEQSPPRRQSKQLKRDDAIRHEKKTTLISEPTSKSGSPHFEEKSTKETKKSEKVSPSDLFDESNNFMDNNCDAPETKDRSDGTSSFQARSNRREDFNSENVPPVKDSAPPQTSTTRVKVQTQKMSKKGKYTVVETVEEMKEVVRPMSPTSLSSNSSNGPHNNSHESHSTNGGVGGKHQSSLLQFFRKH